MSDTPEEVSRLQLQIWLSKPPVERLRQMMIDNEALLDFWRKLRLPGENANATSVESR